MSSIFEARATASPMRRISAIVTMVVGIALLITTFANNLFEVGPAFEDMIDDFRPMLAEESIATARADLAMLDGAGSEFGTAIVPAMSQQLGMTPEQFSGFVGESFPAVANGFQALPTIVPTFSGLVDSLDSQRSLFESADAIPTAGLPATTVPWGLLITGVLVLLAGVVMYKPGWLGWALTGGLGVAIVIATLALSLIPKAADADQLNENLQPIYTADLVTNAQGAVGTIAAMGSQMQTEMLPALASQLGMSGEQLNGFLVENFPSTAQALATMPDALGRFEAMVANFDGNLGNYDTIKPVAFSPIIWTLFAAGLIAVAAAGFAFFASKGSLADSSRAGDKGVPGTAKKRVGV